MNFEGACALALVLWIAIRSIPGSLSTKTEKYELRIELEDWFIWLGVCLTIAASFWRAAHIGFLSDDFILIAHAPDFNARWTFTSAGGDGFYRPLVYAIISWTHRWAGQNPMLWHLQSLAIHAANSILLYFVARAFAYSRFIAGFAAMLFAIHGTRPEVAIWVAGRFDLLATMFVLAALFFFLRGYWIIALIAMIAGLLCKESAYAFPLMLIVVAVWKRDWRRDLLAYSVSFFSAVLLFSYRWYLLGGIGGYRTVEGDAEILSLGLLGILKALALRLWGVLLVPLNWSIRPGILLEIVIASGVVALLWCATARVKRSAFLLPMALVFAAAIPVTHLLLIGSDLEKSRYLYLPSAMFAILLAVMIDAAKYKWIVGAVVLAFHVAVLEHNLGGWQDASAKAESSCTIVATSAQEPGAKIAVLGLPQKLRGDYFWANGFPECVEMRTANHPTITIQRDASHAVDRASYSAVFQWDASLEELKRQP
jgi:hypothetical protein